VWRLELECCLHKFCQTPSSEETETEKELSRPTTGEKTRNPPKNKNKKKNADSHEGRGCRKRRYGDHWAYIAAATTDFNLKFLSPTS
jgi:hypothetical protein